MKLYTSMHKKIATKNFDTITVTKDQFTSQKFCPVCGAYTEEHQLFIAHPCLHCGCEHIYKR